MAGDGERQNFWTTLPGILTGVAAIVTAVTGLIIGLRSQGPDSPREPSAQEAPAAPEASPPTPTPATPAPAAASQEATSPPKKDPTVIITANDGMVTTVYGRSFNHRQHGQNLPLLSGQGIPFERIRSIEVKRHLANQADVEVTLVNGTVHSGTIAAGSYPFGFHGENDLGSFDISMSNVARIAFER